MTDRDDLILSTLMEIKTDLGEVKAISTNQEKCIDQLQKDVGDLKQSRDEAAGGKKVAAGIGGVVGGLVGLAAALGLMR